MASAYKVKVVSAVSDGTNIFLEVEIFTGTVQLPLIRPVFKVGTTAATINSYLQIIANNQPTIAADISALVGTNVTAV